MFVPYLNPYLSQMVPYYPGVGSSGGLLHSGPGPIGGGVPYGSGVPYGGGIPVGIGLPPGGFGYSPFYSQGYSPVYSQGYYGYRPSPAIPYGLGLVHAGYESSLPVGMSSFAGYNPFIGGSMGGLPMSMPMPMQMPMQPAWSMGSPMSPSGSSPVPQG